MNRNGLNSCNSLVQNLKNFRSKKKLTVYLNPNSNYLASQDIFHNLHIECNASTKLCALSFTIPLGIYLWEPQNTNSKTKS